MFRSFFTRGRTLRPWAPGRAVTRRAHQFRVPLRKYANSFSRGTVEVFLTGGTIDAEPYVDTPTNVTVAKESLAAKLLVEFKYPVAIHRERWTLDSKDFSEGHVRILADRIQKSETRNILVTHGTDRIPENARLLGTFLGDTDKTVVFTGAMVPLSHGHESDGRTNLETAMAFLHENEEPGVFAAMHGKVYKPEGLRKDFEKKEFVHETGSIWKYIEPSRNF